MKAFIFYTLMLTPLLMVSTTILYFLLLTNLPQLLYTNSIRNIYFDCVEFVSDDYVYKMKPGRCRVSNIEYDLVLTHDADGFRNGGPMPSYDVAVIGDSFAHGVGVGDDQTFSYILSSQYRYKARNLAIGSYATMRELDVLDKYAKDAKYVVLQYCSNDISENEASLRLSKHAFKLQVEMWWKSFIATYNRGKSMGYRKSIQDLAIMIRDGAYTSKTSWRRDMQARNMEQEASYFGQIVARYRDLLEGKRLIIFEASAWTSNSPRFEATFGAELNKLNWLSYSIIDTTKILDKDDYFFLDDHINSHGHRKLAAKIANEITRRESTGPLIENR